MAVDSRPLPVVSLLNVVEVPRPYVDQKVVLQFAMFVGEFGPAGQVIHDDAARSVAGIAAAYRGAATEMMISGWGRLSAVHVDALDVAAGFVVTRKAGAIAVLTGPADEVFLDSGSRAQHIGGLRTHGATMRACYAPPCWDSDG